MRLLHSIALSVLAAAAVVQAASKWGFEEAVLTIQGKGAGVGGGVKEILSTTSPLTSSAITLTSTDTLKILFTAVEGKTGKKPHQAFLTLHEPTTGLEESFPFSMKDNGKGKVEVTQKDLPYQLLISSKPLKASILLASFGATKPYQGHVFDLTVAPDSSTPATPPPAAERYVGKSEINHVFKADPRSPPKIISIFFLFAILVTLPALLGLWAGLGGNFDHLSKALSESPVSHSFFFGSVLSMEGVFFMYYWSWNLFQTLPVALVVGIVAYVSGSRALTEVQERRLAGQR